LNERWAVLPIVPTGVRGTLEPVTVNERIRQSSISVVESDFAHDDETIAALKRRTRRPKPAGRRLGRRKPA
jgi:hypothetical protein